MIGNYNLQSQMNVKLHNTPLQSQDRNTVAIKRIDNFSYAPTDQIGLGMTSRVYKGKNDLTGK